MRETTTTEPGYPSTYRIDVPARGEVFDRELRKGEQGIARSLQLYSECRDLSELNLELLLVFYVTKLPSQWSKIVNSTYPGGAASVGLRADCVRGGPVPDGDGVPQVDGAGPAGQDAAAGRVEQE